MKKYLDAFPAFLVLFFLVFLSIKSTAIGPIVGFVSSSILFAYQQFLFRTEQPDIMKEIVKLRSDTMEKVVSIQDKADNELRALRDDVAKFSISMTRIPGVVEKSKDRPKVQF
jgi:hypothetical protein